MGRAGVHLFFVAGLENAILLIMWVFAAVFQKVS